MLKLHQFADTFFSPDLPPAQRRWYRLYTPLAGVAIAAAIAVGPNLYHEAGTDYGCETATIPDGKGAVAGALAVRSKLQLDSQPGLDTALSEAAGQAQTAYQAVPGNEGPQPGQQVEACIDHNPLNPEGYGRGGWTATVTFVE